MTILTVKLTVDFSKRLPGFDSLLREDQITLLKACSSEVMMLRCARRYDANTDSIVFANNLPYTRESYNMAGVGDTADPLFRFGKSMSQMKVDNAEYALLTAIVIFSGEFSFFFISVVLIPLSYYSNKIFMRILSPGIKISQQTYEKCTLQICLNYSVLKNYNASIFYTRHPILYWHVTVHFQRNSATTSVIYGICLLNLDPIDLP